MLQQQQRQHNKYEQHYCSLCEKKRIKNFISFCRHRKQKKSLERIRFVP